MCKEKLESFQSCFNQNEQPKRAASYSQQKSLEFMADVGLIDKMKTLATLMTVLMACWNYGDAFSRDYCVIGAGPSVEDLSPAASVHSEDGKSALHAAASKGHLDVLVVLVYKAAGNLDVMDKFKRTPLYIAVEKGHLKAAQFLQKAGASIAAKIELIVYSMNQVYNFLAEQNFDGMGLMHVAAHKGHVKILKWLLTLKNTVNEQDNGGWTSLMWAAEDGNSEALKLLIKKGAKTDLRDKMPFGMVNSAATLVRAMRKLLAGLDNVDSYIDDILIHTRTWEEHMQALRELFSRMLKWGITARPSKCVFGGEAVDFIGHQIGRGELGLHDENVKKVRDAPRPRTKKEVKSFLGLTGYYRNFFPNYAAIASPLSDLTKKGLPNEVEWNDAHEKAYGTLKKMTVTKPVLRFPEITKPFVLRTDASNTGIGAVLLQARS
eukprot:Seg1316.1 transcript_id=Seg1316.1/GoldUCD/mRNA.D3Y31 product="Retrovirus-related Pol polyprotein from transposon 17.6" pseudo=true protein_id=Seg1316.1/GoldUCD/D3Y31